MMLVDAGHLTVVITCPRCHQRQDVAVWLGARLVVTDDTSALRAVSKSKAVDHACGQVRLPDPDAGEPELDLDPDRELDWQERAAGNGVASR